jgi:hypothetical protein
MTAKLGRTRISASKVPTPAAASNVAQEPINAKPATLPPAML